MSGPSKTSFLTPLSNDVRRRHEHHRIKKRITSFTVQVEFYWQGEWKPIVRYDTAHGFAHRDLMHPDGHIDKTPLFLQNFNEALDYAEADLRSNWKSYIERYVSETTR